MTRKRIDFGIDLGTTNSAISVMKDGEPRILKSDVLKDTTPSCVSFSSRQSVFAGDKAMTMFSRDNQIASRNANYLTNSFVEFKRTMGTNKEYFSSNMNRAYSSEELSAEILKKLKSYVTDENINAAVITVPAKFTINQKDATVKAAQLAGFKHCELLQEPVAASFAYGLDTSNKDGIWLVFDLGGGTFDAALVRAEEGIMKVFDTEGDNHLGGKDLDYAVVDNVIIPYLSDNYVIDSFLQDDSKKQILRNAWKPNADEAKTQLSFRDSVEILTELGEDFGNDDEGTLLELDLVLTESELEEIEKPIFQRAINIALDLLKRNNLKGDDLQTVILVGGPTYSPILRRMIHEQISDKTYFDDPMTIVARGAALYASTIDIPESIIDETRNRGKIQLEIKHEPTTVELEEFVTVKILRDKTDSEIPELVFVEMARSDKAWTSPKVKIDEVGEMITVKLNEDKANVFQVNLFDDFGNRLDCEPNEITIIQGFVTPTAGLSYHFGIGIRYRLDDRNICRVIEGLEKNVTNAKGTTKGLWTQKKLRPGIKDDIIKIPLYESDMEADGSSAIYNNLVYTFVITGEDVPEIIHSGSEVELTLSVKGERVSCEAFFPKHNLKVPLKTPVNTHQKIVSLDYLENQLDEAFSQFETLRDDFYADDTEVAKIGKDLNEMSEELEKGGFDEDTRDGILNRLRGSFRQIESINKKHEWDNLEDRLEKSLSGLEEDNEYLGNPRSTRQLIDFQRQAEQIINSKDIKSAKELLDNLNSFHFALTWRERCKAMLSGWHEDFNEIDWEDRFEARKLINQASDLIAQNLEFGEVRPVIISILDLLPTNEQRKFDSTLLRG